MKLTPQKVRKWGDSYVIVIPPKEREILNIKDGDYLDISECVAISKEDMEK